MFTRLSNRRARAQARHAAQIVNRYPAGVANAEMRILLARVEDLVERLGAAADPEVRRLSRQTKAALARVRAAIAERGAQMGEQAGALVERGGNYVRERPWPALAVAALCVLAIGLWTGRAVMSD